VTAPWTSSETTAAIIPAFVTALQTVEDVKAKTKGQVGTREILYANLPTVIEQAKTVLTPLGLAITQTASTNGVQTVLLHTSGEWLAFPPLAMPTTQNHPQAHGSAISYGRRYSMLAVLGIATEDDDGKAAAVQPRQQRTPRQTETGGNPGITANAKQIQKLQIRMKEVGITKRDDAIAACCAFIGRTVTSSKQMTVAEASKVIDGLDKLAGGLVELVANDDGTLTVKDAA
jgi:hypothetical protein